MPSIPSFKNWRFNSFSQTYNPVLIIAELHQIQFDEEENAYGVRLFEGVRLDNPSSVIIIENVTGGIAFVEVPRTTPPSSGQFRVDYLAEGFYGTSFVEFNPADNLKMISVTYFGLGTVLQGRYQILQVTVIPTNLRVEGIFEVTDNSNLLGDVSIAGISNINNDLNVSGISNINGDLKAKINGPQIFNELDADLEKNSFDDSNANVSYGLNGTNNKTSLELTGAGVQYKSYYRSSGTIEYIPVSDISEMKFYIHAKRDSGFTAGGVRLKVVYYDISKTFISNKTLIVLDSSILKITYSWYFAALDAIPANAVYMRIYFLAGAGFSAGKFFCDQMWGNNTGIPVNMITDIMSGTTAQHYVPTGQRGSQNIVWLQTPQTFSVALLDRKSTRLNSSHIPLSRMPSSA